MNQAARKLSTNSRRQAGGLAVLVSVAVHLLIALVVFFWVNRTKAEDADAAVDPIVEQEEQLAEVIFEDESDVTDAATETESPTPNEQVEADPLEPSEPEQNQPQREEDEEVVEVELPEPQEQEPPPPVSQEQRQAVAQPTTNEETPETDEYFWSDVDNRTEQQTQAENPVQWTEESASRTEREAQEQQQAERTTSSASQAESQAEEVSDSDERRGEDEDTEDRQGSETPSRAQASEEGAKPAETEEAEATQEAQDEGQTVPQTDQGQVDVGEQGVSSLDGLSIDRRMRSAFESGAGSGQSGSGSGSISHRGAVVAESSFDQLYGEETAEGAENLRQRRREESMVGDQQGDWERTREALANYDIAIDTGTETHLNTRRNEHASFIHGYHNQLHDRWWDFLRMLNVSRSRSHDVADLELETRVEIRVLADGKVDRVRIVRGSGSTYFDAEAVRIQYDIDEVPPPPAAIVCDDGSVYLHWTLSRAPGRCGTFHASVHCPRGS